MLIVMIVSFAFVCGMFLVLALSGQDNDRSRLDERIDLIARSGFDADNSSSLSDSELNLSFNERVFRPTMHGLGRFVMQFTPAGTEETTRNALVRAGNPKGIDVLQYLCLRALCCIVFIFVGIIAQPFADGVAMKITAFIFSVIIGLAMPDALLQRAITQRQETIRKGLPDTIDLLIVSVEAGTGFDGAMNKVSEKVHGPISEEFSRAIKEMRLGKQRSKALKDMALRVGLQELSTFVAALNQSEQLGVSISNVLRVQSETIRIARIQRIREAAAKLPVKMLFPLVFFIFPAIFLVMLGPGMISIYKMFGTMN